MSNQTIVADHLCLERLLAEIRALPPNPIGLHLSQEQVIAYLLEVPVSDSAEVAEHLRTCSECCETVHRLQERYRRWRRRRRAGRADLLLPLPGYLPRAAAILVVVGALSLGAVAGGVFVAPRWFPTAVPQPISPPTYEAELSDFDRARDFTLRNQGNRIELLVDSRVRKPYYLGLEVDWDGPDSAAQIRDLLYHDGYKPLVPIAAHEYELPPPGSERRVTVELLFHLTGQAMSRFDAPSTLTERVTLLLTGEGIRLASPDDDPRILVVIEAPSGAQSVQDPFLVRLELQPSEAVGRESESSSDGMLHVLLHPLDGADELKRAYFLQPLELRASEIMRSTEPQTHELWVSPGWILGEVAESELAPTRFELLVVQLPFRLIDWYVPEQTLDLARRPGAVLARREIRFDPRGADE